MLSGTFSVQPPKNYFTRDQVVNRNCAGTWGKGALDPVKLNILRHTHRKILHGKSVSLQLTNSCGKKEGARRDRQE